MTRAPKMTRLIIFTLCLIVVSAVVEGRNAKHYLIETDSGVNVGHRRDLHGGTDEVVTGTRDGGEDFRFWRNRKFWRNKKNRGNKKKIIRRKNRGFNNMIE